MLGEFKLSSSHACQRFRITLWWGKSDITVWGVVSALHIHMQIFVSLESLLQKLDFLVTLYSPSFGICFALPVPIILIEPHQFFYAILVLLLNAELELQLRQHELDARSKVWSVVFDEI